MKVRSSKWFQSIETGFILSLILGTIIPLSLANGIDQGEFNAIVGSAIAVLFASSYQRRLGPSTIPDGSLYAIWSVLLSFTLFLLLIFIFQLPSSRRIAFTAFFMALFLLVLAHYIRRKFLQPCFVAIPGGRFQAEEADIPAKWHSLDDEFAARVLSSSAFKDRFSEEIGSVTQGDKVNGLVADLHHEHSREWQRVMVRSVMSGYPVFHYRELEERYTGKISIDFLSENQFGSTLPFKPYIQFKRVFEFSLTLVMLPLLMIVMAFISICVLVFSGRPIFFKQERVGYRGKHFTILKFRTMEKVAVKAKGQTGEDVSSVLESDQDTARQVTGIGRFLRKHRLDELPQFINVLKGEISLVGPRPETVELVEHFHNKIRFFNYRHAVLPGITGWAQIKQGHVLTEEEAVEKLRYDFYYLKHFSPWLDFVILMRTFGVVIKGN